MNTSKPIAGVSYNSEDFLKGKLKDWNDAGLIEYGMFIRHKAEADEKKDHFHIFIIPARRLQTLDLENDSKEFDPLNPDKPLKIVGLSGSKESDWVLYCLHDPSYLQEKGLMREHHYSLEDFYSTEEDRFNMIISSLSDARNSRLETRLLEMHRMGLSWNEVVSSGLIPLRYVFASKIMYEGLTGYRIEQRIKEEQKEGAE